MIIVSIEERTKEIGLRMAIGATPRDILFQFLFESAALSGLGGLGGLVLGMATAFAATRLFDAAIIVPWSYAVGGVVLAILVGCVAGIYPAIRASRMQPTEALQRL